MQGETERHALAAVIDTIAGLTKALTEGLQRRSDDNSHEADRASLACDGVEWGPMLVPRRGPSAARGEFHAELHGMDQPRVSIISPGRIAELSGTEHQRGEPLPSAGHCYLVARTRKPAGSSQPFPKSWRPTTAGHWGQA